MSDPPKDPVRFAYNTLVVLLAAFVGLTGCRTDQDEGASESPPPNILLILADDLGYGSLSSYGNERYRTPNLDQLAQNGLTFTDFHSNGTVCSPTRTALMTGRYQHRAGLADVVFAGFDQNRHHGLQPEKETTIAELLSQNGYATGIFGKWHLGYQEKYNPLYQGFDRFVGFVSGNIDYQSHVDRMGVHDWWHNLERVRESGYQTRLTTDHAIRFIKNHRDERFFTYVPFAAPHRPFQGPNDDPVRKQGQTEPLYNDRKPEHATPAYKAMVQSLDRNIGRIVDTLKTLNLARETLVFFCSDNGPLPRGRVGPLRGQKATVWEGGHRVPAVAYWPGHIEAGTTTDQLTMTMDLMPTILALTGTKKPKGLSFDGKSIRPVLLENQSLPKQRTVFWNWPRRNIAAVRQGPWKLILKQPGVDPPKLFNLDEDLGEQNNVASTYPGRVDQLTQIYDQWKQEVTEEATQQPDEKLSSPEWVQ